jgi:pimeloyl-ACP methyl ester carboxylesterase
MRFKILAIAGLLAAFVAGPVMAAEPAPPGTKSTTVRANGLKFHVVSGGKGPLMLFLHGFPAHWYMWRDQLTEFSKDYTVAAPDTRGVNLSEKAKDLDGYKFDVLVEDVKALAEKLGKKGEKFTLVAHDWGGVIAWGFAMKYPEMLDKLVIVNAPHPIIFEREMRENPIQRMGSTYMFAFNNMDGYKWDEAMAKNDFAGLRESLTGGAVKAGVYTVADQQEWVKAWKVPGSMDAGLNYYRANRLNPPFNETHPAEKVPSSYSAKEMLAGFANTQVTVPTLIVWGLADSALQGGNLSGIEKYVPNVKFKFYATADHWVSVVHAKEVNADIRAFIGKPAK